ncbi:helix-turn-helix domain-containing protein [Aestuariibacter sp. A3R04]|uniref:helix-turn-helix domain-containing protein n=1 Tax=Aestuariibacter sp. A3R04 TaxID=2841571 RepID=UPI002091B87D|nr:helix-turn-helix transcriptional regulator [Aestuariibacter sp. A3R04]
MINVKKLREQRNWSQEQLATMAGLSLRTIQRVEAGNPASRETLKSLSAVFEVHTDELTERVTMIDKHSGAWQKVPRYISYSLWGIKERHHAIISIVLLIVCGIAFYLTSGWGDPMSIAAFMWLGVYLAAVGWFAYAVRWVDNKRLW